MHPETGRADFENVRYRPGDDGTITAKPSRPKVKWKALADGSLAVACPCGWKAIVTSAELGPLVREALASGRKEITLRAR